MKDDLAQAVALYLETRRAFGFTLVQVEIELRGFVRYAQKKGHSGPLTARLAIEWAQQPQCCQRSYWALRLNILRGFARFWQAYQPETQIPPDEFGPQIRRRRAHIYTPEQLDALLKAAGALGLHHPLRASGFRTLVGLLACTGLRVGEALGLCDRDIDWDEGLLTIRHGKSGRSRLIPVDSSSLEALTAYRRFRNKNLRSIPAPRFLVDFRGRPLGYFGVNAAFKQLRGQLGWTQPPVPRLHDLRHTFAVRTLLRWYGNGENVPAKLWSLSAYLGHRHLTDTYWYLSAVPELLEACQRRFNNARPRAKGGISHD